MNKMNAVENVLSDSYYDYKFNKLKYLIANILFENNNNSIIIKDYEYQENIKFIIVDNLIKIIDNNSNDKIIINYNTNEIIEDELGLDIDVIEYFINIIIKNTVNY